MRILTSATRTLLLLLVAGGVELALSAPTSGCGKDLPLKSNGQAPNGPSQDVTFVTQDGTSRKYRIYVPTKYDKNTPAAVQFNCGLTPRASFSIPGVH